MGDNIEIEEITPVELLEQQIEEESSATKNNILTDEGLDEILNMILDED